MMGKDLKGQTLLEVVMAIALGSLFVIGTVYALSTLVISNSTDRKLQTASDLASELITRVKSTMHANWNDVYFLPHSSLHQFYIAFNSSELPTTPFLVASGTEVITVGAVPYTRYFYVDNVTRLDCGAGEVVADDIIGALCDIGLDQGLLADPSTQKITVTVTWPGAPQGLTIASYLTRDVNRVFEQKDWSGGPGQEAFSTSTDGAIVNNRFASSTNINFSTQGALTISPGFASATLYSSVYDTNRFTGAGLNSIMWQGTQPAGATVKFQVAATNYNVAGGLDWSYEGAYGDEASWYTIAADTPISLRKTLNNKRFMRYVVRLDAVDQTPVVNSVILNWSP